MRNITINGLTFSVTTETDFDASASRWQVRA